MSRLPQQNDFRTFCTSNETEKVYQKLEEIISNWFLVLRLSIGEL
jgi:hypothetical protein